MPDEKPPRPPEDHQEERAETEEEEKEHQRETLARVTIAIAKTDLEKLAGHCFDMGSALREKAKAIEEGNLRQDILAAHKFNEAARQMKKMIGQVDRSHMRYLESNPDVE